MRKRLLIMLLVLIVVFGGIFGGRYYMIQKFVVPMLDKAPPPTPVSTTVATTQTWTPNLSAVGTLVAVHGVNVSPEVGGMVKAIKFKSGQMVKQGDLLVQLDTAVDIQALKKLQAQLKLDKANYLRYKELYGTKVVSTSDMQAKTSAYQQSLAAVANEKALIAQKSIRAPFSGKVGIRQVNLGQYVSPGNTLVNLQSLDPLYVNFTLPEQNLSSLAAGQAVTVYAGSKPQQSIKLNLNSDSGLEGASNIPSSSTKYAGKITAIDSQINQDTRTILVQASIPNHKHVLLPGSFVQVHVALPVTKNVVTLPQTAVTYSLYGNTVYVVQTTKTGKIVKAVAVQTGDRKGDLVEITSGIKPGDVVVIDGQNKLHSGAAVTLAKQSK